MLLHEGLGSVGLWRGFPQALREATGRRVVAFSRFGHGRSDPPRAPRTPAFFHEEARTCCPRCSRQLDAPEPVLVGHSDGASIALIHAGRHPVTGLALLAPHVFVEEVTVDGDPRHAPRAYAEGELRARMARHHDDPDAAFCGLVRRVAGSRPSATGALEPDAQAVTAPALLIQGADDPYGTPGATRPHRGARARAGAAAGGPGRPQPASGAA